jgi:hypothetical protein
MVVEVPDPDCMETSPWIDRVRLAREAVTNELAPTGSFKPEEDHVATVVGVGSSTRSTGRRATLRTASSYIPSSRSASAWIARSRPDRGSGDALARGSHPPVSARGPGGVGTEGAAAAIGCSPLVKSGSGV